MPSGVSYSDRAKIELQDLNATGYSAPVRLLRRVGSGPYHLVDRWRRAITSKLVPPAKGEAYRLENAAAYWVNVPRAEGGDPFDTSTLGDVSDKELLAAFEQEMDLARKKHERRLGFSLAEGCIQDLDAPAVLDYGSGIGFYGLEIMARHPGARVTFADISRHNLAAVERIAAARGLSDRVSFVHVTDERATSLDIDTPLDLIVSMGVLHHTPYAPEIVASLSQSLKANGLFLAMLYNRTYMRDMEKVAGRRLEESGFGALTDPVVGEASNPYSEPYDDDKAARLFAGYALVSAHYPTPHYNTYVFRKTDPT